MSSMLCPVLIGRGSELHTLTAVLDRAGDGHGSMVFLAGDPGVGKSRLAREISALAAERGFDVLSSRAVESTAPVPFRPITEALMKLARSGVVPDAAEIADYRPALGSLVPEWRRPGDDGAEISPLIIGEALIRLLSVLRPAGALLVFEDFQWADRETLAIAEYLADNLAGRRVLCVFTLRESEPSAGLDVARSIHARRAAALIEVPRLTARAVEQMAAACLDTDKVPREVTRRLLADCDGLPFAVEEILAAATSSGELVRGAEGWHVNEEVTTGVPASIVGSVRNRLGALGPQAAHVIVSAAVIGRQFDWSLLPSVADVAEPEVLAALQRAHDVQLIEPIGPNHGTLRFRHNLTRDAIVSDLLPPDLARRSATAATVIEQAHPGLPADWCELAAELRATAGQPAKAAELLLEAGRRALGRGALSSAIETLQDARKLLARAAGADSMLAVEIDEELARALALAGDYDQLAPLAEHLIAKLDSAGADPRRQAQVRIWTARTRSQENPAAAAAYLSAARAVAGRLKDAALASQIDAAAAGCAIDAGDLDGAEELARQALAAAERAWRSDWAAEVAFESLEVIGRRERLRDMAAARTAFERAYEIASEEHLVVQRITALHELGTIEMLEDGSTGRLLEARDLAHQAGAISAATVIDLQLAHTWSLGTDLGRALAAARQSEQGASRTKARRVESMALSVQALIAGIRGERREVEALADRAEALLPGDSEVLFSTWGLARVTASLFADDIPRARQESAAGRSYGGRAAQKSPRRAWGYFALLRASYDTDGRRALRQARAAGAAVGWNKGYLAYAEAVLEGRDGHRQRASELAEEGQALLKPYAPWWNYLARRLVADAALRDDWGEPLAWLREATAEFDASGHARLASACRGMLRRAGERVPRAGRGNAQVPAQMRRLGVTSREMDVLLLVARGLPNAEIAARLFISPKTVETHIASLAAKTGQSGRRELVAHAAHLVPAEAAGRSDN